MAGDVNPGAFEFEGPFGSVWPIGPIQWADQPGDVPASPFHPESKRPIGLTLHSESLTNLNEWEASPLCPHRLDRARRSENP